MFQFFHFAIDVSLSQKWHYVLKLFLIDKMTMLTHFFEAFKLLYQRNLNIKILYENVELSFLNSFFFDVIEFQISSEMLSWIKLMHLGKSLLQSIFFRSFSTTCSFKFISSANRTLPKRKITSLRLTWRQHILFRCRRQQNTRLIWCCQWLCRTWVNYRIKFINLLINWQNHLFDCWYFLSILNFTWRQ